MGILVELGVVSMMMSGSRSGLNRRDVLVSFGGVSIARAIPGVLFRVFRWCERGFSWSVRGAVARAPSNSFKIGRASCSASGETIFTRAIGILVEFGVVSMITSESRSG